MNTMMMMMKLSMLLLLALQTPGLLSISLDAANSIHGDSSSSRQASSSSSSDSANVGTVLEWVTWKDSLPNNAVSIYNDYEGRVDYICKYKCSAGFYNPDMGPYCHYPNDKKADRGSPFEILVNKDNFEILRWESNSLGSVPKNSVRTCPTQEIYVGKNKYGLGEVVTKEGHFYLPWKSSVYKYSDYQVLTVNKDVAIQEIYSVKYNTDNSEIINYPPETVRETSISNYECLPVVKTDTLSKTNQVKHTWDIGTSISVGASTTIKVGLAVFISGNIKISPEVMFKFSLQNTVVQSSTDSISVQVTAPPNNSCMIKMLQDKYKISIPFTALLTRTYTNGEIRTISITGMYDSVQVKELQAVTDRCQPLEDAKACQ